MQNVTPMILTTGFLGAGKTTTINEMLDYMDRAQTAVIVNEFGAVSIDGLLLKTDPIQITNLPNGCACCTVSDEFQATLRQVIETKKPHSIVFETSGLANPIGVLNAIYNSELANICRVDLVITIVDGDRFEALMEETDVFLDQIMPADLLLVNKGDLIDEEKKGTIEKVLRKANPKAPIVFSTQGKIAWAEFLDPDLVKKIRASDSDRKKQVDSMMKGYAEADHDGHHHHDENCGHDHHDHHDCGHDHSHDHEHTHDHGGHHHHHEVHEFKSFSFPISSPMDPKKIDQFVQKLPRNVFRGKGLVRLKGYDGWFSFQSVSARYEIRPYVVPNGISPESRLVFIGKNMDESTIYQQLSRCT